MALHAHTTTVSKYVGSSFLDGQYSRNLVDAVLQCNVRLAKAYTGLSPFRLVRLFWISLAIFSV